MKIIRLLEHATAGYILGFVVMFAYIWIWDNIIGIDVGTIRPIDPFVKAIIGGAIGVPVWLIIFRNKIRRN